MLFEFSFPDGVHDIGRRTLIQQFLFHKVHVRSYMLEEFPVTGTKVVQPGLTVCGMCKAVFRTFAVAGEQPFALPALGRE